ncbi:SDR family oxidoreductase [Corticibacterium sp. UT-5YL-CI-8]|nr:SDR family oxidoreductase [Tianweitania sp. UT-5YL-CI-8]
MNELLKPLAVVTGGAGGIGRVICEVMAEQGWRVVVADINEEQAYAVASSCGGHGHRIDIMDEKNVETEADAIEVAHGPVDALIHSAATFGDLQPAEETAIEDWDRITRLVHRGTFIVHVAFARRMATRGKGSVVTLSSWNGFRSARMHAYCTSKAAVNLLTESMAAEWGRSGVRFNAVSPGVVMTPRVAERIATKTRYTIPPPDMTALGRLVSSREVAEAVAFLASDKASGITGANLAVDAGTMVTQAWGMFGGVPGARPLAEAR